MLTERAHIEEHKVHTRPARTMENKKFTSEDSLFTMVDVVKSNKTGTENLQLQPGDASWYTSGIYDAFADRGLGILLLSLV